MQWRPHAAAGLLPEVRRADVVHLTGVYSFPDYSHAVRSAILRKPLVWSPRGALQRWAGSRRVAAKWLWEMACTPFCRAAHDSACDFRARTDRKPAAVSAPLTTCNSEWRSHPTGPGLSSQRTVSYGMGFIGRLDPKKGLENLLDACAMMKAAGSPFTLTIAGGGPERYTRSSRRTLRQLGLGLEVRFAGEVHNRAKRDFLRRD